MAARGQKIPILIHEQNAVLGRVNRAMAGSAAAVACGFERLDRLPAKARGRKHVVGNPVRLPILAVREKAYPEAPAGGRLNVLVIGGSQGARLFGEVVPAAIEMLPAELRARLDVSQQAREEQVNAVRQAYAQAGVKAEIAPFFSDMGERLARAHLVISRAGASSVTELQAAGRPAILIPFAAAADDHQTANAEGLTGVGAADVLSEAQFEPIGAGRAACCSGFPTRMGSPCAPRRPGRRASRKRPRPWPTWPRRWRALVRAPASGRGAGGG